MDIDSIVNDLMRVERLKVDKAVQNRTLLEWTREKYNEVNKMFANFVLNTKCLWSDGFFIRNHCKQIGKQP